MIRLLLFIILALVVARVLWRLVAGVLQGMGYQPADGMQKSVGLVRDPVCGMFIVPSRALTSGSGSETRYFCSEQCRQSYSHSRNTEGHGGNTEGHSRNTEGRSRNTEETPHTRAHRN
jgi:YHS domain-containing protein